MKITEINNSERTTLKPYKLTEYEQDQAHSFLLAKQLTGKLLRNGLISSDEYDKIMVRNRASFLPDIASLYDE